MQAERSGHEPLAIVGIGCRLPGDVDSPASYWDLLCSGTDATRVVPESRWNAARFHDPHPGKVGKMVTRRGGFLDKVDQFDPQFFGISPREAHLLDPQQRLLLQATWEALEDGASPPTPWQAPGSVCSSAASPWTTNSCRTRAAPVATDSRPTRPPE